MSFFQSITDITQGCSIIWSHVISFFNWFSQERNKKKSDSIELEIIIHVYPGKKRRIHLFPPITGVDQLTGKLSPCDLHQFHTRARHRLIYGMEWKSETLAGKKLGTIRPWCVSHQEVWPSFNNNMWC